MFRFQKNYGIWLTGVTIVLAILLATVFGGSGLFKEGGCDFLRRGVLI